MNGGWKIAPRIKARGNHSGNRRPYESAANESRITLCYMKAGNFKRCPRIMRAPLPDTTRPSSISSTAHIARFPASQPVHSARQLPAPASKPDDKPTPSPLVAFSWLLRDNTRSRSSRESGLAGLPGRRRANRFNARAGPFVFCHDLGDFRGNNRQPAFAALGWIGAPYRVSAERVGRQRPRAEDADAGFAALIIT